MRILAVSPEGILDTATGEVTNRLDIEQLLTSEPGGVIAGNNLYNVLARLVPDVRKDEGWTMTIHAQSQRVNPMQKNEKRVKGIIYISRLTYRRAKERYRGKLLRPPTIKWLVLNLELFTEPSPEQDILATAEALIELAGRRGIKPRHSPGGMGSAMLRASGEWEGKRRPAPRFISEIAREHLPGNFYALSSRRGRGTIPHCYYLDQQASHHKITNSVPLPHPHFLRARGRLRAVEDGKHPLWIDGTQLHMLRRQVGLLCCYMECDFIPNTLHHLYPPWAVERGNRVIWIWTPELRLLDRRVRLRHICCALTSHRLDPALLEYSEWALEQLQRPDAKVIKSSLLAGYGMLGVRQNGPLELYTVHGRKKPPRAEDCELPLIKKVYRSTIHRVRTPSIQNVIARGVIEAETRTRSIEYARALEGEGIPVAQIYADGLLAVTDQLPLILPDHWRAVASLTRVRAPHPNSIISDQLTRLPGIQRNGREAYLKKDAEGWHSREHEPHVAGI
jgi:hypothetical protein